MKFSELQNTLKEKFGIDHLADIARELGVTPQAVSNWKARNRVPYKYVVIIREKINNLNPSEPQNYDNNIITNKNDKSHIDKQHYQDENGFSFMDILITILSHIRIILFVPSFFCIIMIIHVQYFAKPVYLSNVKFMSSSSSSRPLNPLSGFASQFGFSVDLGTSGSIWVYPEIIKSRTLSSSMLKRKFDTEEFGANKSLLQILTYGNKNPEFGLDTLEVLGRESLLSIVNVSIDGSIYDLTVSASEPQLAADIANAFIDELDKHQREYNSSQITETRQFIEERIIAAENELNIEEEKLKDFRERNRNIGNSPNLLLEQQRLLREVSVLTGVFTTLKQQLETTKIEEVKDSDFVIILDPADVAIRRSKPNKRLMVIISGLIGIFLGIFLSFIIEYFTQRFEDKSNNEKEIISNYINRILIIITPRKFYKRIFN